jgi:2,3-dihydro-2,3-dihydroxybenzoate dehydrogenase
VKKAVVSGAAGGLGREVVKALLNSDFRVIALDLDISGLDQLTPDPNLETHIADVTDPSAVKHLLASLNLDDTGLDLLICLAGSYDTFPVTERNPADFNRIMAVNFLSCPAMVSLCLPALVKSRGRVIVVSSESYKIQAMFQPYMISKAALEAYCRVAWQELALKGVALSVIRPGAIRTPLLDWMNRDGGIDPESFFYREFQASLHRSKKMVGKITPPEKVAAKIIKAATTHKPKRYYHVNNNSLLSLISILPNNWIDALIVRKFRRS